MVRHGELARDRPAVKSLTEFFLWMSVGGVLGGIFNAILAPLLFNSYVEYQLSLVLACLLLPSLGWDRTRTKWGAYADFGLAYVILAIGGVLILLRGLDHTLTFNSLTPSSLPWIGVALAAAVGFVAFKFWRAREKPLAYCFDLLLPGSLLVLVIGLVWGLPSRLLVVHFTHFADYLHIKPYMLQQIFTFALPAVLCYTFVERSTRFGLGLGAIFLAGALGNLTDCFTEDNTKLVYQTRSFFGVLRVEQDNRYFRLMHGTTLHGTQILPDADYLYRLDQGLSYYSTTGPIGHLFGCYNARIADVGEGPFSAEERHPGCRPNIGVIGLGTGTMAWWAEPGQHLTFYDIDPAVRDISFKKWDKDHPSELPLFTYVDDARERGVIVEDLELGDARLMLKRKQLADEDKYGILIVDAFSSDAIPIHLINQNALQIYKDKITEDGIIAFHISNRYLNLLPVVANLAEAEGMYGLYMVDLADKEEDHLIGKTATTWVVLARKPEYLHKLTLASVWERQTGLQDWPKVQPELRMAGVLAPPVEPNWPGWTDLSTARKPKVGVWTDDYSNLLSVFKW